MTERTQTESEMHLNERTLSLPSLGVWPFGQATIAKLQMQSNQRTESWRLGGYELLTASILELIQEIMMA